MVPAVEHVSSYHDALERGWTFDAFYRRFGERFVLGAKFTPGVGQDFERERLEVGDPSQR